MPILECFVCAGNELLACEWVIYHNPRCSKSRECLKILVDNGHNPEMVPYLDTPPAVGDIGNFLKTLKAKPRDLMRQKEAKYADQRLGDSSLYHRDFILALNKTPKLLEHSIVAAGNKKVVVARPPERVLDILGYLGFFACREHGGCFDFLM